MSHCVVICVFLSRLKWMASDLGPSSVPDIVSENSKTNDDFLQSNPTSGDGELQIVVYICVCQF